MFEKQKKVFKEKVDYVKWKIHLANEWCKENKEAVVIFGPVIAGGIIEVIKIASKNHILNEEKALKERYVYDRSNGHYYELKRKPKQREWLQIEQRKTNGETLGWILNDMKLLK